MRNETIVQPNVNSAALEAVIIAAEQLVAMRIALGLESVSYVLGESNPVELDTCIEILKREAGIS